MQPCTTRKNRKKFFIRLLSCITVICIWQILTLFFSPLVVPTIKSVIREIGNIISTKELYSMIGITIVRLFIGLLIGGTVGTLIGVLMGKVNLIKNLLEPIIGILQTIPPVSWLVLALVWFGFNGKPAVFIIAITTIPTMAIHVEEGISDISARLMEMAGIFDFSTKKRIRHIILPSIMPYFKTGIRIVLGGGWKIAVMAEVLTTNDGIGGMIKKARLNIEPESIIAWSVIIVLLFYISDYAINKMFFLEKDAVYDKY